MCLQSVGPVRRLASVVYQCAYFLALHDTLEVARNVHVEDIDGKVVLHAHGRGGDVHDLQSLGNDLLVGDVVVLGGTGVLLGVSGIDAIYAGTLEHDVGLYLNAS